MNKQQAMRIARSRAVSLLRLEAENGEGLMEEASQNGSADPEKDAAKIAEALEKIADALDRAAKSA